MDERSLICTTPVSDDNEFPNLENIFTPSKGNVVDVNDFLYVNKGTRKWPVVCKNVNRRKKRISVIYINCSQSSLITVPISKTKHITSIDSHLFVNEEDIKEPGLYDAMNMVSSYKTNILKINKSPVEFFSLDLNVQKQILHQIFIENIVPEIDTGTCTELPLKFNTPEPQDQINSDVKKFIIKPEEPSPIVTNKKKILSARDKRKLQMTEKARDKLLNPLYKYIRSTDCLDYLKSITLGQAKSKRHNDFMVLSTKGKCSFDHRLHMIDNNPGFEFCDHTKLKLDNYVEFLLAIFSKKKWFDFLVNNFNKRTYVMLVLYPEAIKQGLRIKRKVKDEDILEHILKEGLSMNTRTERKARKITLNESTSSDED